ncbi:hypothetical protein VitviT2T_007097 [Vitis vinifera]|uniref:TIR domain-containing protein n=1 Tax=Vitis vinifera TaxID=29760 RepID=A0ABY9BYC9_VITVI|nr:hypothetical protein VitviT2T_007097 [Vitis vinifera]
MASTSSTSTSISTFIPQWKYDVFLSFRGEDTRFNFTDHLYANLIRRGITTFRDDDSLKRGEEIAPELLKAIEESRFALIVFSENYAGSRWCLDELVKIMKCREEMKQTVVPIFYHVDPSHVRHQKERFGEAFSNYKEDTEEMKEKVRSWRSALIEAANISGVHVKKNGYESEHVKEIVNDIFKRLNCKMLDVGDNLVGMDFHVNEIIRKLCVDQLNDVRIIGICGIGGMEMGWNIIRSESPGDPTKWSRLWDPSDVCRAFRMGGMKNVEAIFLDLSRSTPLQVSKKTFAKMKQLRLLKIYSSGYCGTMEKQLKVILPKDFQFPAHELRYLHWEGYPLKSLPPNSLGENLVELNMKDSNIKQLRHRNEHLERLKILNLIGSKQLTEISNFSNMPNLEKLELAHCTSLNVVDPSIGDLKKLTVLNLGGCKNLKSLPRSIQLLDSLKIMNLSLCSNLEEFPEMERSRMKALYCLRLHGCGIKELPSSIEHLTGLKALFMSDCKNLRSLPNSICRLKSLHHIKLSGCSNLDTFPEITEDMKYLGVLDLRGTGIKELPSSQNLKSLWRLDMSNCLVTLPDNIYNLRSLKDLTLQGCCSNLEKFPKNPEGFCSLERLDLSNCNLMVSIPSGISQLRKLRYLDISHCKMLQDIPELPSSLREIDAHHCTKLEMLSSPSSLLWSSLLKWFNPTSNEHLNCKEGKMILILGNGGIPGWVLHQEIGSQVRIEPPLNWYEDDHFLGFAFFTLFRHENDFLRESQFSLRLRGDPDEVVDDRVIWLLRSCYGNCDALDRLLVTLYHKNAIPSKYHRKQPWHFLADFVARYGPRATHINIRRCGVQLIYTHDYLHDNVPMLLDHQKGHDDAGVNQADDQEPHPKRLRASSTDLKL